MWSSEECERQMEAPRDDTSSGKGVCRACNSSRTTSGEDKPYGKLLLKNWTHEIGRKDGGTEPCLTEGDESIPFEVTSQAADSKYKNHSR